MIFSCPNIIFYFCFTCCSCTLSGYYEIWSKKQENAGIKNFKELLNSTNWRQSWYSFVKLLDIDYGAGAECQICGKIPDIIICDDTSLGYQKKFATAALQEVTNNELIFPRYS